MTSILEAITGGVEAPPADTTAAYDIVFACAGWKTTVGCYRTDAPITPKLGYGGHPVAARPKKKALTVWEGRQPFAMSVPVLLSEGGSPITAQIHLLDQMASAKPETANQALPTDPYTVTIHQRIGQLPLPGGIPDGATWWIEDLVWGDEKRDRNNEPYYREVLVELLEVAVDQTLPTKGAHPYRIKKGDTWAKIAARQLGDQERQFELREMNGNKTDAWLKKNVGKTIRIPASL